MGLIDAGYIINRIIEGRRRWGDEYDVEQVLGDIEDAPTIEEIEKVADPKAVQKVLFSGSHLDVMTKAEVNRNCKKIIQIVPVAPNEYIVEVEDER